MFVLVKSNTQEYLKGTRPAILESTAWPCLAFSSLFPNPYSCTRNLGSETIVTCIILKHVFKYY